VGELQRRLPAAERLPAARPLQPREQTRRALADDLDMHYSMEELSVAEAAPYLPIEMRQRLSEEGRK